MPPRPRRIAERHRAVVFGAGGAGADQHDVGEAGQDSQQPLSVGHDSGPARPPNAAAPSALKIMLARAPSGGSA